MSELIDIHDGEFFTIWKDPDAGGDEGDVFFINFDGIVTVSITEIAMLELKKALEKIQ